MPFPEYVPTRAVTVGGAMGLESARLLKIRMTTTASKSLVWDANGYRFERSTVQAISALGTEASMPLPCTDVDGWRDAATGALIDVSAEGSFTHQYTTLVEFLDENERSVGISPRTYGPYVVPTGDEPIDLDKTVPTSTAAGGLVLVPDSWSLRVAAAEAAAVEAAASLAAGSEVFAPLDGASRVPQVNLPAHLTPTALEGTYGAFVLSSSMGIVGDGVVDDGPAIVAAAQSMSTFGGGTILFPAGVYKFGTMLILADNVEIRGVGESTHFLTTYEPDDVNPAIEWRGNNIALRDIKLEAEHKFADEAGFDRYELVRIGGTVSAFTDGVTIQGCVFLDGGGVNAYCTKNVKILGNKYTGSHGNSFGAVNCIEDVLIDGNVAQDGNDDLIAITCDSTAAVAGGTKRFVVSNNILKRTDAKCIATSGADGGTITGNVCEDSYGPAMQIFTDAFFSLQPSNRIIISDNVVRRGGKWFGVGKMSAAAHPAPNGIHAQGNDLAITANLILDTQGRAVQVPNATRISITENIITGSLAQGINIGDTADSTIAKGSEVRVSGNILYQVAGGIVVGGVQLIHVSDNHIRSFKNGGSGSRHGIAYGNCKYGLITGNVILNDDAGNSTIIESPSTSAIDIRVWGNQEVADPAAAATGSYFTIGGRRITYGTAAPTTGAWGAGDLVINANPSAGGDPWAWICRTAGTPGTWQALAPVNLLGNTNTWTGTQTFTNVKLGNSTTHTVGFYGSSGTVKPTVSGSRAGNAALDSLLTALAAQGLIVNSSTA